MAIVATDQITLIDITDTRSIQVFLEHNHPVYQVYKPGEKTFSPNWEETPLIIKPTAYVSGLTENQMGNLTSVEWYIDGKLVQTGLDITATKEALTIRKNLLKDRDFLRVSLKVVYYDSGSGVYINGASTLEFVKVEKGEDGRPGAVAVLEPLDGLVFRLETDRKRIRASIMIDGEVKQNPSSVKWFYAEPKITETSPNYDPDGGEGWSLITDKNNMGGEITGFSGNTLYITGDAVEGSETFKAVISDSGQTVSGAVTLTDLIDQYQVVIQGNNVFRNNSGELKLEARLMVGGEPLKDLTNLFFSWYVYTENQEIVRAWTAFGPTATLKFGEVPEKGFVTCDVFEKLPE